MAQFKTILALSTAVVAIGFAAPITAMAQQNVHDPKPTAAATAAVADAGRPDADKARDDNRKPAQVLAVSGLKPGDAVAELGSGGGYYTRILSKAVGPKGKIIAVINQARPQSADPIKALAANYPNVSTELDDYAKFANIGQKVDVVWTTENYHDFHNAMPDMTAFNKAVFDALKPGGIFFVEDHAAAAGSGTSAGKTLHRIDPATVKQEVTAAGFKLVRTSDILANPADDHAKQNAEADIRGHTDRFIMVFQKP